MADRLTARARQVAALEATVLSVRKRASAAEARVRRETRRLVDAQAEVHRLSERVAELEIREAERADELASWDGSEQPAAGGAADEVAGLLEWEQRSATAAAASVAPTQRRGA
jgi:hypothetical protein